MAPVKSHILQLTLSENCFSLQYYQGCSCTEISYYSFKVWKQWLLWQFGDIKVCPSFNFFLFKLKKIFSWFGSIDAGICPCFSILLQQYGPSSFNFNCRSQTENVFKAVLNLVDFKAPFWVYFFHLTLQKSSRQHIVHYDHLNCFPSCWDL